MPATAKQSAAKPNNPAKLAAKIAAPAITAEAAPEAAFTITATQPALPPRTLKYGDTFVVLDSRGDIGTASGDAVGLFHNDTRHLSRFELLVNGAPPLLLGSNLRDDNSAFFVDLTNPDLMDGQHIVMEKDRVHILRTIFLWRGTAYQRLGVRNYGDRRDRPAAVDPVRQRFCRSVRGPRRAPRQARHRDGEGSRRGSGAAGLSGARRQSAAHCA